MNLVRPIVFLDLETTGTDKQNDRIVELSMLKIFNNQDAEIKTVRINPGIPIPPTVSEIHGIKDEDVKNSPTFKQLATGILSFIYNCDIAGFNSNSFDVPLLYSEFNRAGKVWDYSTTNFIDIGNIFKRKNERTLSVAYKEYCGKELEGAHSAETDVKATMEVFMAQLSLHTDLPANINELAKYSNFDKDIIDLGGCFAKNAEGDYIFNFGKHKDKKCKDNISYLSWMLNSSFMPDAKTICLKILAENK